ncbi:MAG: MarR family transcriptional regulator [Propionicimonas sp.]|uniref:MarR family winged helix-turn-helix transcriptional regulator n=1 Tax=Propionicimonas sp. TaxID=1955623 RepID=UPI003D13E857
MSESATPRWLTPDQTGAWIALASTMVWLPAALEEQLARDAGVSLVEYSVLSWLSMQPSRSARMSDIAALANVRASHLSRIAARLEGHGWLRRAPDPADGRATIATLTAEGWDKVVATAPGHVEEVQRLVFDGLSPTRAAELRAICESVLHAARPDLCLPSPLGETAERPAER